MFSHSVVSIKLSDVEYEFNESNEEMLICVDIIGDGIQCPVEYNVSVILNITRISNCKYV